VTKIIRESECRIAPWKNGGGTTREIICVPEGVPDFDWRISIAHVNADGPFSLFPGLERHIMVLDGDLGMELIFDNGSRAHLQRHVPFSFSGDLKTSGRLIDGPVRDFNLMVRRKTGHGVLKHLQVDGSGFGAGFPAAFYIAHILSGTCTANNVHLAAGDTLTLDPGETMQISGSAEIAVCTVTPVPGF
jgi:uncharacterized protein